MTIRIFTREQLEAWDLPDAWADDAPEILRREQVDSRRWVSVHELIFRAPDDGKTYQVYYEQGLTESQDGIDPWNYDREIKGTEVEQRTKITKVWEPVSEATMPQDIAAHVLWHERKGGYPASTFSTKLLGLWTSADTDNADRLSVAFPDYAAAIALVRSGEQGVQTLRAIAGDD